MTDTFRSRIPALSDEELRQYLARHVEYRREAVEEALRELDRRGLPVPAEERARIQGDLEAREAAADAHLHQSFVSRLGGTTQVRLARIRQITACLLAVGLGSATAIYLLAAPKGPNPLGYEPEDTKRYLRDLELYGGKVNVLATEFMRWWDGLWHGRSLAFTVAWLSVILACAFWFVATRRARFLDGLGKEASHP